jgi:hypothetical protein
VRFKIGKRAIGLFLIILMFGSTIAYSVIQATFFTPSNQLPETNVVREELSFQQERLLLSRGITIAKYFYNQSCLRCLNHTSVLEQLASDDRFKDQLFVEEIISTGTPRLTVISFQGTTTLVGKNVTIDSIVDSICLLMFKPPIECALRQIQ